MSSTPLKDAYGTKGVMGVDYEQRIDFDRMRDYRVGRIKKCMDDAGISCLVLFETGNKRYATSTAVASPEVDNMSRYAIACAGKQKRNGWSFVRFRIVHVSSPPPLYRQGRRPRSILSMSETRRRWRKDGLTG